MSPLTPSTVLAQPFLPVKGIVNARDLGGYEVHDGRHVRSGLLLRAAHLADATPSDLDYLASLPLRKVIDFRTDHEKKGRIDRDVPGAEYVSLPIDASGALSASATEEERKSFTSRKKFSVKSVIVMAAFNEKAQVVARDMISNVLTYPDCQRQIAAFLRLVVDSGDNPILFHCSQGKDRTGIASALLLAALGADRETIIADFDATNRVYARDIRKYTRKVKFWGGKEKELAVVKAFIGANTEGFIQGLRQIDETYGSLESYLKGPMGLTETDLQTLRNRYLE